MKDKDKTKVSFVDSMSAEEVTGSSILVETPNYKILLDCGFYQSNDKKKDYRNARRCINILDKADAISDYAKKFELILIRSSIK